MKYVFIETFFCWHYHHLVSPALPSSFYIFKHSFRLNQTFPPWNIAIFLAGITDLMCFIWLVDRLHFFTELFFISQMFLYIPTQQCGTGGDLYSIYQMMLKGHTYKTFKTTPGTLECRETCLADDRRQSFNFVIFIAICELNNQT